MLKARYHKLRLRFSLWYSRTRNSWNKWWHENVSSIRLTKRGLLGIYLMLVLLIGTLFMSRFQDRLGQNISLDGNSPPANQQDADSGNIPPVFGVLGVEPPQLNETPSQADSTKGGSTHPNSTSATEGATINDEVGIEPVAPVVAPVPLAKLHFPLAGASVQNAFAMSAKSKTLGDWRSHLAVDFSAQNGAEVQAAAAGVVSKVVTNDPYWGTIVTLDHGGGWSTSYSNISSPMVREGERVAARQPIGQITENPPLELLDALHLHFVFLQNGQPIDSSNKWNE